MEVSTLLKLLQNSDCHKSKLQYLKFRLEVQGIYCGCSCGSSVSDHVECLYIILVRSFYFEIKVFLVFFRLNSVVYG